MAKTNHPTTTIRCPANLVETASWNSNMDNGEKPSSAFRLLVGITYKKCSSYKTSVFQISM